MVSNLSASIKALSSTLLVLDFVAVQGKIAEAAVVKTENRNGVGAVVMNEAAHCYSHRSLKFSEDEISSSGGTFTKQTPTSVFRTLWDAFFPLG